MKNIGLSKNFWVALVTIAIISISFTYYLMVYVKDRERMITSKRVRELKRIALNVNAFKTELANQTRYKLTDILTNQQRNKVIVEYSRPLLDSVLRVSRLRRSSRQLSIIDSIGSVISAAERNSQDARLTPWLSQDKLNINEIGFDFDTLGRYKVNFADSLKKSLFRQTPTRFFILRVNRANDPKTDHESRVELQSWNQTQKNTRTSIDRQLLSNRMAGILYQNLENEVRLEDVDSLLLQNSGLRISGSRTVRLGDDDYVFLTYWASLGNVDDIVICSVEKAKDLRTEAYQVEPWIIINLIFVVLVTLLGTPLLKLLIMNEVERLQIRNVFFTGIGIVVGTGVIMIIANFSNHFFGERYDEMDASLVKVSDSVKTGFITEVNTIRTQLKNIRGKRKMLPGRTVNEFVLKDSTIITHLKDYRLFNEIIWMNNAGDIIKMLSSHAFDTTQQAVPKVNNRKYFTAARAQELWRGPRCADDSTDLPPFYIDFVRSHINGQYQAAVSNPIESDNAMLTNNKSRKDISIVAAITTKLFSMQYAGLPPWFESCLIDDRGEVKFHSTGHKSLQENFIDEADNNPSLIAGIRGRIGNHTTVVYDKKRYRVYTQPIDGMPLHLLIFYPLDQYKTPMILTVWYASMLFLTLLTITAIHLVLLFFSTHRPSKLRIHRFFLGWLRPRKPNTFYLRYVQSLFGGALVLIFQIGLIIYFPVSKETIIGMILTPVFLLVFHFLRYYEHDPIDTETTRARNAKTFVWASLSLVLFLDLLFISLIGINWGTLWLFAFQFIVVLLLWLAQTRLIDRFKDFIPQGSEKRVYLTSLFLWLIAVSIIPVFCFYKYAYEEQSRIWLRSLQLKAAESYAQRMDHRDHNLQVFNAQDLTLFGNYEESSCEIDITEVPCMDCFTTQEDDEYHKLLFELTPPIDIDVKTTGAHAFDQSKDNTWNWRMDCESLNLKYHPEHWRKKSIAASSILPIYRYDLGELVFLFWIAIGMVAWLGYRCIRFALRYIYGFEIIKPLEESPIKANYFKLIENKGKNFFVVGMPYSGKGTMLRELAAMSSLRVLHIDLQADLKKLPRYSDEELVVIEHFEFGLNDHAANKLRLQMLEYFQSKTNAHVIIGSAVQPEMILDYYDQMLATFATVKEKDICEGCHVEYKHAERYWRSVLSGYVTVYMPLMTSAKIKTLRDSECYHGNFLPRLMSHVANQPIQTFTEREDFVIKIEEMAVSYYQALWSSFSKEEKRLLYDLAIDRFVNVKNISVIRILMQKGVLTMGDSLQIFNKSFNNFILSVVKEDEEIMMQQELRSKGSWSSVQLVLMLVFLAITFFISFAQRDILQNINTLLTAVAGVAALVLRFGGLFTIGKGKE